MYTLSKNNNIYLDEIRLKIGRWNINSYCVNKARTKDKKLAINIFTLLIKDKYIHEYLKKEIEKIMECINIINNEK